MRISEHELMKMATAYIEDGVVKKWRHYSDNEETMTHKLHIKQIQGKTITGEELAFVKGLENVVIVEIGSVQFINFSGTTMTY